MKASRMSDFVVMSGDHAVFDPTRSDLRATYATGVRRMSGLPHVPALVLGHQGVPGVPDATSRYDRADTVPDVSKGLNAWAPRTSSRSSGPEPIASGRY
jgi:hypothetical protein